MRKTTLLVRLLMAAITTVLMWSAAQTPGRHWFDAVLLPAYLVGAAFSGNVHQASELVTWLTAFASVFGLAWGVERFARKVFKLPRG